MTNISNEENIFLSENFDFIEEAAPFSVEPLEFKDMNEIEISESKGAASPYKLIGKVRGCMAPIGVYSRNHRIYENNHWPKALANPMLRERLENRRLYGMPSHMNQPINDEDFREGRISHIVSVLEVRNDENGNPFLYGEFDILDTPAGRILKAMYEGGAGIYVSTRAAGRLLPIPGDSVNKRVDPDSYFLSGIDCVLNPGFLQAKPAFESVDPTPLVNMTSEGVDKTAETQDTTMNKVSEVVKESLNIETSIEENETLAHLSSQLTKLTKIVEKVVGDVYELPENVDSIEEGRKPGESDEEMKTRLHKELVHQADDKADKAREKGDWKEYKKQHDKLDKLDDISPVYNAYASEDLRKAAIPATLQLLKEANVSEEVLSSVIDSIMKGLKHE